MAQRIATVSVVLLLIFAGCTGTGGNNPGTATTTTPSATTTTQTTTAATPTTTSDQSSTTSSTTATTTTTSSITTTTTETPTTTTTARTSTPTTTPTTTTTARTTTTQPAITTTTTHTTQSSTPTTTRSTATQSPTTTSETTTTTSDDSGPKSSYRVEVVQVIDGDTLEVEFQDGHTEDVRLLGVDTPEVHVENDPAEFEGIPTNQNGEDWLRDWGHKASEFARTQLAGETITIETDEQADRRGSYGRLLVYAYADSAGKSFNEQLIEQGYARMYDSSFSQRSEFTSDEQHAQDDDVGLWNYEAPTDGGTDDGSGDSSGSQLAVATIHADASGNDHENENGEYIALKNTGSSAVDLSGWTLEDAADHTYSFPDGFTLDAGATVTIYTGSGTNSATELYWGSDAAVWNNGGDTIIVTNADGTVVLEKEY